jgi:hypothetical protein
MVVNGEKPAEPVEVAPAKPAKRKRETSNQAPKEGKGASLIAALKADWQPFPKLLEMTGWLKHTLRGYIEPMPVS